MGRTTKNNKKVRPRTTNKSTTGTTKTFYRYKKQNGYILEPQDFKTNNQRDENSYFMGNVGKRLFFILPCTRDLTATSKPCYFSIFSENRSSTLVAD